MANPGARFQLHEQALLEATRRVIQSGRYILGAETEAFEAEFATYVGARECVGVASGTDAITLGLGALGVVPGDEVLTVSHTAVATVAGIERAGAVPVLVDIDPVLRTLDPLALDAAVGPRSKAVVVVHIYGQPADMAGILAVANSRGLRVLEDCAQAHGATIDGRHVGTFGDAGAFSFYPTKNLGAVGDGGAVVTNDQKVSESVRRLRQYGWNAGRLATVPGTCSRLDELHAAMLRVMLARLGSDVERRRTIAARYDEVLAAGPVLSPAHVAGSEHAYHLYVVELAGREAFAESLRASGVATGQHYPRPVHLEPAYEARLRGHDALPNTEHLSRRILSLPMFSELTETQVEHVCRALETCLGGLS